MKSLFLSVIVAPYLFAATYTETFTNSANNSVTTTGVWNVVLGQLTLPFAIDRSDTSNAIDNEDEYFDVGTGGDGAFDSTTFSKFDSNATSTSVTLDTSRVYQFSSFTLDSGVTLNGSGSDPLRIKVQGDVLINGTIDISGGDGEAVNADTSVVPQGGTACCGGGAGGNGGSASTAAQDGTSADAGDSGKGGAGTASATAPNGSGGGGGGGFEGAPFQAAAGSSIGSGGTGGAAGGNYGDVYISTFVGGSGGGGGAAYTVSSTNESSGGGGGGGGGAVKFEVGGNMTVSNSGEILANGGDGGGSSNASLEAGCGGGGSGGAISLLVVGTLTNNGRLDAKRGTAGSGSDGGAGGQGAFGRTRYSDQSTSWSGTPVSEDPTPNMVEFGQVHYTIQTSTVETNALDMGNSSPTFTSVTTTDSTPGSTGLTYAFAGSANADFSSPTAFVSSASLSTLNGMRFIKMRVTMTSSDRDDGTPTVSDITLNFTERHESDFGFVLESCARVHNSTRRPHWSMLLFFLFLLGLPRVLRPYLRA